MTIALNDLFRVNAVGEVFNQRIILTAAYAVVGTVPPAVSEVDASGDLLEALRGGGGGDAWESSYLSLMPPSYTLRFWQVQKVAPVRYRYYRVTRDAAGTHASDTEAPNQAAVVTMHSLLAGRGEIGNKHIGPLPQGANIQDGGNLAAAYKTLLSTWASQFILPVLGAVTDITWSPVIAHKTPPGSYTTIANYLVQDTVNTMRRRTVGRGE